MLQECLKKKHTNNIPQISQAESCLVAVYLSLPAGNLQRNALICLPKPGDISKAKTLFEAQHKDPNETLRKATRAEHVKHLKRLRKQRVKQKKKNKQLALKLSKVSYIF